MIVPQVHGAGGATAGGSGSPGTIVGVAIGEPILPADVAIDASGDLLITELAGEPGGQIRKVAPDGSLTNVAAAGPLATSFGFGGDGGPALDAAINGAGGLTVDGKGNILFADSGNQRIRRISRDGIITTVAGSGPPDIGGFSGDGGLATDARLNHPSDVAVDAAGNLYIADLGNRRIRKVSPDGIISTFAGNGATITDAYGTVVGALTGDGGSATGAAFAYPSHVAVDGAGNVYVSDGEIGAMYPSPPYYPYVVGNNRVRKIDRNGVITTIAGIGDSAGSPGIRPLVEGGSATETALGELPGSLVVDTEGNVYVAVQASYRVRRISPDGLVSTVVGSGPSGTDRYGFPIGSPDGDGALATQAHLGFVNGLALDKDGNLFTAERATTSSEGRLRKVFAVAAPGLLAGRPFPGSPALVGDVDGNGQVEVRDALLALRGAVGIALLSAPEQAAADVNGDGQMDLRDVTLILRKAIGL